MRWVVVFKGARDQYQVPLALAEADQLQCLVTDAYFAMDRAWVRGLGRLLGVESKLHRRYCEGLPSARVRANFLAEVRSQLSSSLSLTDDEIGESAGRMATRTGAGLLSYSYYAHAAFGAYRGEKKIIFQAHPHPQSVRDVLREELERVPAAHASLMYENEMRLPEERLRELCDEPREANFCIAASNFTKLTLVENGVAAERIAVVPYGVDAELFSPARGKEAGPFRVLFVGQLVQRKGLSYLLQAWRRACLRDAELVLAGRGAADTAILKEFEGEFRIAGAVKGHELRQLYRTSDVFCMPSLAEGFGLVYLEAMASGLALIATPNTGAADLVEEGRNGFIVPVRDVEALADVLAWCSEHRSELQEMGIAARRKAERYSWQTFRANIRAAIAGFCEPIARDHRTAGALNVD